MNKTKLKLTQHRGNLRLWIESKALAAFLGSAKGALIRVEYAKNKVTISCATAETMTNIMTQRPSGAAIIDLNSAQLTKSLGADCKFVDVIPSKNWPSLTIRPAKA